MEEAPQQVLRESMDAVSTLLTFCIEHSSEESNQALADFLRRLLLEADPDSARAFVYLAALTAVERHAETFPRR